MLTLLIVFGGFCIAVGIVYPIVTVAVLRILGDRRPLRDLLDEI